MGLFRSQVLRWALVVSVGHAVAASAQPQPAARQIVTSDGPGERPAVVYGAPDVALTVLFDAPLRAGDGGFLALPGAEVRPHPFRSEGLILTPSRTLAERSHVPMRVALSDGGVSLVLAFGGERVDQVVQVVREHSSQDGGSREVLPSPSDLREVLSALASTMQVGTNPCGKLPSSRRQAEGVAQNSERNDDSIVCVLGGLTFLSVKRTQPNCLVGSAILQRPGASVGVFLIEPPVPVKGKVWQTLVVKTPREPAKDFELLLIAEDRTLCERYSGLTLRPGGER